MIRKFLSKVFGRKSRKIIAKYDSDLLSAIIEYKDNKIDEAKFQSLVTCIMSHLDGHLGTAVVPELYKQISVLRADFLKKVMNTVIQFQLGMGGTIPNEVKDHIKEDSKCDSWVEPHEEEQ